MKCARRHQLILGARGLLFLEWKGEREREAFLSLPKSSVWGADGNGNGRKVQRCGLGLGFRFEVEVEIGLQSNAFLVARSPFFGSGVGKGKVSGTGIFIPL